MAEYKVIPHSEADVNERRDIVQLAINLTYPLPNTQPRTRSGPKFRNGCGDYRRERLWVYRGWSRALGPDALDGQRGPELIAVAAYRLVRGRLEFEGYPVRIREEEYDIRPGGPYRP